MSYKFTEPIYSSFLDEKEGDIDLYRFDAHIDGKNVGFLTTRPETDGNGIWLEGLYVVPEFRGKGIAKKLIQNAMEYYGNQEFRLKAVPFKDEVLDEDALKSFYRKLSFEEYDNEGRMKKPVND